MSFKMNVYNQGQNPQQLVILRFQTIFALTATLILRRNLLMVISSYFTMLLCDCTGFRPSLKGKRAWAEMIQSRKILILSLDWF